MTVAAKEELLNFVGGAWQRSAARERLDVHNPATGEAIAEVPLTAKDEVDAAVRADEVDRILGTLYATVEQVFRPLLRIGFASRVVDR